MAATRIGASGEVTIPDEIREAAHLEEGDPVEVEMTPDGILLRPQKVIDSTQAWFWTPEWQDGERQASADIAEGRLENHQDDESFLASLEE